MSSKQSFTQKFALWVATVALLVSNAAPSVLAARMYFQDNPNLRKGCPGEINVMLDTEGQQISVADAIINYDSSRLTVNSINNGSIFQAVARAVIGATSLDFSAMSFVGPFFNGSGAFATLDVDVPLTASSATLTFDKDYGITSLAAYDGTNYLNNATDKTFSFKNRYNADIDGGFCDPDTTPPQVQLILPGNGSGGNDVDTNIVFSLQDNRAGVDIDTLSYEIEGVSYTENSSQTSYSQSGGVYSVTTNPDSDFSEGQKVNVEVYICDQNTTPSANCRTWRGYFHTYTPPPPDPVCGDGIVTYSAGEQCDDGNNIDGDGCSALCLLEVEVVECPPCPECPEVVCEPEEVELREAAEEKDSDIISEEIKGSVRGCTRKDVVLEVLNKFDVKERYSAYDARCKDDIEHCMLPFLIHSSYEKADPENDRYYPDVYLKGERREPLLEDDAGPMDPKYKEAIHLATRVGMIHGFYEDTINLSPFRPEWNMTRMQIIKVLNWAVLGQQWDYKEEYIAKIGGEENLQNVKTLASDLTAWWYPRYYNRACEAGIFACDPNRPFEPNEICDPAWKRNIMAKYQVFYKQQGDEGFGDEDGDNITDRDEQYVFQTDPKIKDTDNDSLDDGNEITTHKTNPLMADTDKDGLSDADEIKTHKTDPIKKDTDGDDVPDGIEIELGTDPLNKMSLPADTNANGIDDEWEIKYGISPQNGSDDTDNDGLSDLLEYRYGTNPLNPDTDGDGISDADEVLTYGSDPLVITRESDLGMIITNISDGMTLTDTRPLVQGYAPQQDMEVEVFLRNEFGHEASLGKTTSDIGSAWALTPEYDLLDGEFFLLAKGLDPANKQVLSSPLIKVKLDSSLQVDEPQPERLANKTITDDVLLEGLRLDISDSKPMLIGKTGYKNRVVATWQSVIGTSAIVADLAGGEFRIEAPKELPFGEHNVSVYAIRESDQAVSKVVTLNFSIKEPVASVLRGVAFGKEMGFPNYVWFIIIIGGGGLIGFGMWYDRKKHGKKK